MALPQQLLGLLVPGHVMAWLGWGSASTCLVEPEAEAEDSHDARIGLSRLKAALASEIDGKHGKAFSGAWATMPSWVWASLVQSWRRRMGRVMACPGPARAGRGGGGGLWEEEEAEQVRHQLAAAGY